LPDEYKEFISTYGTGGIDNFIWILNPFVLDENFNLMERGKVIREAYLESKQNFPQDFIHDVYPDVGGLLPWAITDNGDEIYWRTDNNPNKWSIVIYGSRSSEYAEYNKSLVEFLYEILTKRLVCSIFPDDFPSEDPQFITIDIE
jgi:hypothetical protein